MPFDLFYAVLKLRQQQQRKQEKNFNQKKTCFSEVMYFLLKDIFIL